MEKTEVHFDQEEVVKEQLEEIKKMANQIVGFGFPSSTDHERHIREGANQEARLDNVVLDSHGLTPGMRDFCLAPAQRALETFSTLLYDFQTKILPYREKMTAMENLKKDIEGLQEKADSLEVQAEKEVGSDHHYKDAKDEYGKYKQLYGKMFDQKGQVNAKDFPLWLYLPILFGIGVIELAINYFAILEQYGTPILAGGLAAVIGLTVAASSHLHGTLLKQHEYYFGDAVEPHEKRKQFILSSVAAIMLLLAFGFVGWNRYLWAMAEVVRATVDTGGFGNPNDLPQVNIVQSVLVTMIGNILVYLLGAVIAFWVHDADPLFTKRLQELKKATARWHIWQTKVDEKKKVIKARIKTEIEEKRNESEALAKRYKPLYDEHNKVVEKEVKIRHEADVFFISLLNEYKNRFESNAKAMNPGIRVIHNGNTLTIGEYAEMRLGEDYFTVLANQ